MTVLKRSTGNFMPLNVIFKTQNLFYRPRWMCVRPFIKEKVHSGNLHSYNLRKIVTLHIFVLFCEILIIFVITITIRQTNQTLKSKLDSLSVI